MKTPVAIHRSQYVPPAWRIDQVDLDVSIAALTSVSSRLSVRRSADGRELAPLVLDGREMTLQSIAVDGRPLEASEYRLEPERLTLTLALPDQCVIEIVTHIDPETNGSMEGFYRSGAMLCTQCEAEGFSRITYFPDRPDVLARYRVRLEADAQRYPVLLCNGEPVEEGACDGGRHYVVWNDPFPKPCYLFAMVAGDLACVRDRYRTVSGRDVDLRFYCDHGSDGLVGHAIESLKAAMAWDERVYDLECDLSTYMVVAARDFNMGAMENKGLNLFNSRFVLASPETASDADHDGVESVIAHEYFHNWTGNRVTCRSWFELSLKEGLTVFRDQCFSADLHSPAVQRIGEVRTLRSVQFVEDAGPMAHPVRPEQYVEVNNLYTATVYEKGAEIVRMLRTVVGDDAFVEGVKAYLCKHDGDAATIEDFILAHEAVSGLNLQAFRRWYAQPGTPVVRVWDEYEVKDGRYRIRLQQAPSRDEDAAGYRPLPIPIRLGLWTGDGQALIPDQAPGLVRPDLILLDAQEQIIELGCFPQRPLPSFLHGFSAPVKLQFGYSGEQLATLLVVETDGFARWEAVQRLMLNAFFELLQGAPGEETALLCGALQRLAAQAPDDRALLCELLRLPSEQLLASQTQPLDAQRLCSARDRLRLEIAQALTGPLSVWAQSAPEESGADAAARRALSNLSLWYLAALQSARLLDLCASRIGSRNMTLVLGGLAALNDVDCEQREQSMARFRERFADMPLVLDKWFALQSASAAGDGIARVQALLADPAFSDNPNRVRSVFVTLWRENLRAFHRPDGAGYRLLGDQVAKLDARNPQLAARLVEGLLGWRDCVSPQRERMRESLEALAARNLSKDVGEKVARGVAIGTV